MKRKKIKAEKRPACNASNKESNESLIDLDSDEILETYGKSIAGREQKKKPKMPISGKSVFTIRNIIIKKASKLKNRR